MTDIGNINILSEAKKEYTNQLQKILKPRLYEGFKSIYEDILQISGNNVLQNNAKQPSVAKNFQKVLKEIPQWNQEMIKKEYGRILKLSSCDYIDKLIEAVFVTNTKILTSVQINNNNSMQIKINIPQPCHFIHKCYIKSASEIYKNPYLFDISKNLTPKEKHNNLREALLLIDLSINNAVSDLLPFGEILKQSLMLQDPILEKINKKNKEKKNIDLEESYSEYEEESEQPSEQPSEEPSEQPSEQPFEEQNTEYLEEQSEQLGQEGLEEQEEFEQKRLEEKIEESEKVKEMEKVEEERKEIEKKKNEIINLNNIEDTFKINKPNQEEIKKIILFNENNNTDLSKKNENIKRIIYDDKTLNNVKKSKYISQNK